MPILEDKVKKQVRGELSELTEEVKLIFFTQDEVKKYRIDKIPATVVEGKADYGIRFYGIPSGYEFTTLVESILDVSQGTTDLSAQSKKTIATLSQPVHIQVFTNPTCPYCPMAVRMAHKLAIESDLIRADMIEAVEFPHLIQKYQISGVPKVVFIGALPEEAYVVQVMASQKLKKGGD